jgi:hypothetical protein
MLSYGVCGWDGAGAGWCGQLIGANDVRWKMVVGVRIER